MTKPKVVCIACSSYNPKEVKTAIFRGLTMLGGPSAFLQPNEKLLIKPNLLVGAPPEDAVTTHPIVFGAVAEYLLRAKAKVSYGDSPGFGSIPKQFEKAGYSPIVQKLNLKLADFKTCVKTRHPKGLLVKSFSIAKAIHDSDGLISISKLKPHGFLRLTGAVKNQFGCIPGFLKPEYHCRMPDPHLFSKMLVDLNQCIKPRLYIMDAITAMEGNGPRGGTPRQTGFLLFSADPVALDSVACHLIHLKASDVPTNTIGALHGLGVSGLHQIILEGDDVESLRIPDFKIPRMPVISRENSWLVRTLFNQLNPKPVIKNSLCTHCGKCINLCPIGKNALDWPIGTRTSAPQYRYKACIRCFCCQEMCPEGAISIKYSWLNKLIIRRSH